MEKSRSFFHSNLFSELPETYTSRVGRDLETLECRALPTWMCAQAPWDLVKMQILILRVWGLGGGLRFCISYRLWVMSMLLAGELRSEEQGLNPQL